MKKLVQFEALLKDGSLGDCFGVSKIQRLMLISYNQAKHVLDEALKQGLVESHKERPWLYAPRGQ